MLNISLYNGIIIPIMDKIITNINVHNKYLFTNIYYR